MKENVPPLELNVPKLLVYVPLVKDKVPLVEMKLEPIFIVKPVFTLIPAEPP